MTNLAVHHSSKSAEHYTPQVVIDAVLRMWGEIDLDPCSNSRDNPNIPARRLFTIEDDGLAQDWTAKTLYLNPPYGRDIGKWVGKLVDWVVPGWAEEAIALVPARTDTRWFGYLSDYHCCFVRGRLKFGGNDNSAPFPSAIFYLSKNGDTQRFVECFRELGDVWVKYEG